MRRTSLVIGTAVVTAAVTVLVVPPAARAANTPQSVVVSGTAATNTPQVLDGEVDAMVAVGPDIVMGGTFTQVQDTVTTYTQPNIVAFNASTGLVDTAFRPTLDGPVKALDANGSNVIAGGTFAAVNAVPQRGLTELDLSGARVPAFTGALDGMSSLVNTLVVRGSRLFVGGRFTGVDGTGRSALAVLDATTGAVDTTFNVPVTGSLSTTNLEPVVATLDVTADGHTVVIGGNFTTVGGQARTQLAIIDATAGAVTGWQTTSLTGLGALCADTSVISQVNQLNIAPDGTYFVLVTQGGVGPGTLCDTATRWELGSTLPGQTPTWVDATGGDTLTSVAATGTAVYVAGHMRWMNNDSGSNSAGPGAIDRKTVAALDPQTGLPLSWNPGVARGTQVVGALLATSAGLYVGSDSVVNFGAGHDRLAFFPVSGGTTVPAVQNTGLPKDVYLAGADGSLRKRAFNSLGFNAATPVPSPGTVPWASVTGAFMLNGQVCYGTNDGLLHQAAFDGSTVGVPTTVTTWWNFAGVKSFTAGDGRMYYVTGDGNLYYRWFSQESNVIGSQAITVAASGYTDAGEMFVAGGSLYFARTTDHKLYRVALSASGIPTGSPVAVSGPGIDPMVWDGPAVFLSSLAFTAPPAVTMVSPSSGATTGGTPVTLTGSGFAAGDTVAFGAVPGTSVTVVSATQITVTAPAGAVGVVDVTVTSAAGGSYITAADHFTYGTPAAVADLIVRNAAGNLYLFPGNGTGGFAPWKLIGSGWNGMNAIVGVGDFNGDGHNDVIARDTAGRLWLFAGTGIGTLKPGVQIGSGWSGMTAIVGVGDFNGDGHPDLIVRNSAGKLYLFPGNGTGGFKPWVLIGSGWSGMTAIVGVGDLNGDGHPDLVVRNSAGNLYLFPGNGIGGFKPWVLISSGWNSMNAIVGPGDFNGDGHADVISRATTGRLYLFPGTGTGTLKPAVLIGSGWSGMTAIVAVGDLNH